MKKSGYRAPFVDFPMPLFGTMKYRATSLQRGECYSSYEDEIETEIMGKWEIHIYWKILKDQG